jgi:hypothetical protein
MRLIDLTPLHEIDFRNQAAFDTYNKQHKLRPDTKVNIAGKNTTAGQAAQSSKPTQQPQQQKPQGQKLGGNDFKSSAEKGSNDDVDISGYKTDGEGKVLYKGKPVADYVYSPDTDVFVTKTPNGREYFDTQEDMFKYLQKSKEEEPKKQGVLSKMANMFTKKDNGGDKKPDTSLSSMIPNKVTQQYNPAQAFNQKVSKMTDNNAHSAAAVELAIYMDDKEAVSKLQQIKKYHDNRGYLRPSEAKERGEMVNNLLQRAQKELPKKDFDLISSAF